MRRLLLGAAIGLACNGMFPERTFDCAALADAYATGCPGHLGISTETTACASVRDKQNSSLARAIDRAAAVCEAATTDPPSCDEIFVCVDDVHGLSALARGVRVTGTATVEGETFTLDAEGAWAWVGTRSSGNPSDFEVLFTAAGRPWYFRLADFAERARTRPFAVDAGRPIKLENSQDNVELAAGTVTVAAYALDGAFDVAARGTDPATGEAIDVRFVGTFAEDE